MRQRQASQPGGRWRGGRWRAAAATAGPIGGIAHGGHLPNCRQLPLTAARRGGSEHTRSADPCPGASPARPSAHLQAPAAGSTAFGGAWKQPWRAPGDRLAARASPQSSAPPRCWRTAPNRRNRPPDRGSRRKGGVRSWQSRPCRARWGGRRKAPHLSAPALMMMMLTPGRQPLRGLRLPACGMHVWCGPSSILQTGCDKEARRSRSASASRTRRRVQHACDQEASGGNVQTATQCTWDPVMLDWQARGRSEWLMRRQRGAAARRRCGVGPGRPLLPDPCPLGRPYPPLPTLQPTP